MFTRGLVTFALAATAVLAGGSIAPATAGAPAKTIAIVTSVDYRAVVTVRQSSSGTAPTAAVTVTTYSRAAGHWALARRHRLPETYFWKTVTAPRGLCRLEISTAAPGKSRGPRLVVQLLLSPALGCGRTFTFALART
jgi:hypothetical protein